MAEWEPLAAGSVLNERYEVEALLGKGGFGATYLARDRGRSDQPCALKELLPAKATNPKVLELFEREARILHALRHPGIPALHAYFTESGRYYLVQDFVRGRTLAQLVEADGPRSEAEVMAFLREAVNILQYLHGRNPAVIHRDIKPTNMIRAESGRLNLIDFGAVKEALGQPTTDPESTVIKSAGYTPPEQTRGVVVPASDLYALGATALHLLSGRHPYDWYDALAGQWKFAGRLGVSPRLEAVLTRLLEEQLTRRVQSAAEALALIGATDVKPSPAPAPPPAPPPPTDAALAPLPAGTVIGGRYAIRDVLHHDRGSATYRAVDRLSFERACLVIELFPTGETETRIRQTFESEARRLSEVTHPALPRILAFFPAGSRYYVLHELVEGETLGERVRRQGPLPELDVVDILRAVLDAFATMHGSNPPVVHGALSPARLVAMGPGAVMFTDFRSFRDALAGRETARVPEAARPYTAPEEMESEPTAGGDLYALGALCRFLLTAQTPTPTQSGATAFTRPGVSPELSRLLAKMTAVEPAQRFASVAEVQAAVDELPVPTEMVLPGPVPFPPPAPPPSPVSVPPPVLPPVPPPPSPWLSKRNLAIAAVIGVLALAFWLKPDSKPVPIPPTPVPIPQPQPQPQPIPQPQPQPRPVPSASQLGFLGVVAAMDRANVGGRSDWAVVVKSWMAGTPVATAGLRRGDVITGLGGRPTPNIRELYQALRSFGAGADVRLDLLSGGQPRSVNVRLMASPYPDFTEGRIIDSPETSNRFFASVDPNVVEEIKRQLTGSPAFAFSEFSYLSILYPAGWSTEFWPTQQPYKAVIAHGPDAARVEVGLTWQDNSTVTPESAFQSLFWPAMQRDSQGAQLLGDRALSPTAHRFWYSQQFGGRTAMAQLSIQVSTSPVITFGQGARRSFVAWRLLRVPGDDRTGRALATVEAMRQTAVFIPAL